MRYLVFTVSLLGCLGGCATAPPPAPPGPTAVDLEIQRAAYAIQDASSRMAIGQPTRGATLPEGTPTDLVDISFVGPLNAAITTLAGVVGYEVLVIGRPTQPVIVNATARRRAWSEVVQALQLQLGSRGELVVDVSKKRVEVRYGG